MQRELLTPGLSLAEGGDGEGVYASYEGGQPDHTSLVAHDEAAGAVLVDAAPGRLGQVGRGQHEEGEGGVRGVCPSWCTSCILFMYLEPGLLGGSGPAVGKTSDTWETIIAPQNICV